MAGNTVIDAHELFKQKIGKVFVSKQVLHGHARSQQSRRLASENVSKQPSPPSAQTCAKRSRSSSGAILERR